MSAHADNIAMTNHEMPTRRIAWPWAVAAAAWTVLSIWGHLPFSIWLVSKRQSAWGTWAFKDAVPMVSVLAAVGLGLWLWRHARAAMPARRRHVMVAWLLWLTCCWGVDRWLTFSVNEYAHYPQYALLAWLIAHALDAQRERWPVLTVVLITTLTGAVDETLQYLWTTSSYSRYLDFNDWLVNLLAGWAGVMLFYGFANPPAVRPRHAVNPQTWLSGRRVAAGVVPAILLALAALSLWRPAVYLSPPEGLEVPPGGRLQGVLYLQRSAVEYGHWHPGPRHGRYWVMAPHQATILMVLGLGLAGWFGQRGRQVQSAVSESQGH